MNKGVVSTITTVAGNLPSDIVDAKEDFRQARLRGIMERLMARLSGESAELFCYEDVRQGIRATSTASRGLQNIPIDAIVGSVGRCGDFTRTFLPRRAVSGSRWARVKLGMTGQTGLPPIEVYKVDEVYFVLDGNHRVSVARELGATTIQAFVTEVQTNVPFSPDDRPDQLILKAEYADFMDRTKIARRRPDADLSVSVPGQYAKLDEHISVHRYLMGIDQGRPIPYKEAVDHWHEKVYLPVVQIARDQDLLHAFPNRTEADLYLWISEHRAELEKELGWEIKPEAVASDIAGDFGAAQGDSLARLGEKVLHTILPSDITSGPAPGEWRREHTLRHEESYLFSDILVPVSHEESSWTGVEQALEVARREQGRLLGIHVAPTEARREDGHAQVLQSEFDRRCKGAGVQGRMNVVVGRIADVICDSARWTSLIVAHLDHPPADQPVARLSSGLRTLIQRCPSPVLAVPHESSRLSRALLAYDGSPKAEEALFVSTYLASRWNIPLTVVTVLERGHATSETTDRAQTYLEEHDVAATVVTRHGPVGEVILAIAEETDSDLIVVGGYGHSPVMEIVLGSAVDQLLRESQQPVLICR